MKFKLLEDLETDLQDKNNQRKEIIENVRKSLSEQGFKENKELNGISFEKEIENDDSTFYCQFYLDLDNNKYKSYVSNDSDSKVMFTQEGEITETFRALDTFVKFLGSI